MADFVPLLYYFWLLLIKLYCFEYAESLIKYCKFTDIQTVFIKLKKMKPPE